MAGRHGQNPDHVPRIHSSNLQGAGAGGLGRPAPRGVEESGDQGGLCVRHKPDQNEGTIKTALNKKAQQEH